VLEQLAVHPLAGNVRELENLLHRAVALSDGQTLQVDAICAAVPTVGATAAVPAAPAAVQDDAAPSSLPADLQAYLDQREREILVRALHDTNFNRTAAAQRLGLSLRQIRYRISRLAITVSGGEDPPDSTGGPGGSA
jgi:two-component system response regulator PilR (NtrC family)